MADSSSDQANAEEILNLQFLEMLGNYMTLSAFVLWFHDFFLTFPTEFRAIWSRKLTGASMPVLFIVNRYSFMLYEVLQLFSSLSKNHMTDSSCKTMAITEFVLGSIADVAHPLLSILRVYALFGQKQSLFVLLCVFIVADVIVGSFTWFSYTSIISSQGTLVEPFAACQTITGDSTSMWNSVRPVIQIAFTSTIFLLTLAKTARPIMQARALGMSSIAEVVLREGTLCFFFIFIVVGIQAAIMFDSIFSDRAMSTQAAQLIVTISAFLNILPNILINRFVLNLRAYSDRTVQHSGSNLSNPTDLPLGGLKFAENRFIGNMGTPLYSASSQWDDANELRNEVELVSNRDSGREKEEVAHVSDRYSDREIHNREVYPLTTLVPVIYDYEGGSVSFVPIQRERGRTWLLSPL